MEEEYFAKVFFRNPLALGHTRSFPSAAETLGYGAETCKLWKPINEQAQTKRKLEYIPVDYYGMCSLPTCLRSSWYYN